MREFILMWVIGQRDKQGNSLINSYALLDAENMEEAVRKVKKEWGGELRAY